MIQYLEKELTLLRQLAFLSLFGAVIMIGFVAYTLAVFIHDGGVGSMPVETVSKTSGDMLSESIEVSQRKETLYITLPFSLGLNVYLLMMAELLKSLALVAVFFLMAKFFHLVAKGQLFMAQNSKYLKFAGNTVATIGIYYYLRGFLISYLIRDELSAPGSEISGSSGYMVEFILVGMILVLFGYIMEEGRNIYEEQKLTV
ncbi:DUF2975 domain-containing protein [Rhodohalobacter halophilus]|uniref:DUF2975 domain-containing protein n=1 Tax=Rhodohalobacter halophilus TaxID=1812810 RepID=UPI00159F0FFD|nr:DUF2975 domain-containing protein [Rhodohalobacter halophilus]